MKEDLPYHEKELLQRTSKGDELAFTSLFNKYWNHIYSVAFILTKSKPIAEDVVQEIFLKIWQKRSELSAIDRFDNYLFILARNHIYSEFKKLKVRRDYLVQLKDYFNEQSLTAEDEYLFKESGELIEKAIAQLPSQQQEVYRLGREKGYSHEAIAQQLGLSVHTVRNHMIRAIKGIRQYLARHDNALVILLALVMSRSLIR